MQSMISLKAEDETELPLRDQHEGTMFLTLLEDHASGTNCWVMKLCQRSQTPA